MSSNDPYPSYPADDARSQAGHSAVVEQPPSIKTAVLLMRAGAGLALVGLLVTLATFSSMKDETIEDLRAASPNLTDAELDTVYLATIGFTVVVSLISVALWLWMASANGKGKKWARTVATVLGGLSILLIGLSLSAGSGDVITTIFSVLSLLVGGGALFYMYRPDSKQFYEASSRPAY